MEIAYKIYNQDEKFDYVSNNRVKAKGKFLFKKNEKYFIKGVTYGTFKPDENGDHYNTPEIVERDFYQISSNNINSIRTYTVPPKWFLDIAQKYGLKVLVGIPWEQHITFLDEKKRRNEIVKKVKESVKNWGDHPSVLGFAIGNEIPSSIVRWYGHKKIEQFLYKLYKVAKNENPESLITYINYPTTEYLDLSFLDFISFNVYLESKTDYENYLSRLQNIAGDLPIIIAEIGLDSKRNGLEVQAEKIDWQTRSSFSHGYAGTFVFSWTDEWNRGGYDVEDWDFGITDRNRKEKPALLAVKNAYSEVLYNNAKDLPLISVVVCSYNGSSTIRECLEGLSKLSYPKFEVIIVNDGSSDSTLQICEEYLTKHNFKLISTENMGLSNARNTGINASSANIIAFIDDDAYPDQDWLTYLSLSYTKNKEFVGFGGPNLSPSSDGPIARCVAQSPGGPVHVLINDIEAEHIAGCNMSFLKSALTEVKGFDTIYKIAGDDVDMCWRLIEKGYKIGYSPSALVWHHRRDSIKGYLKQQYNYGKSESLLEKKWPEKYNSMGHVSWSGQIYGNGSLNIFNKYANRIYYGIWGKAPFQSIYKRNSSILNVLTQMPETYLFMIFSLVLTTLAFFWKPLLFFMPIFIILLITPLIYSFYNGFNKRDPSDCRFQYNLLTSVLYFLQPIARLSGRLISGLTIFRNLSKTELSIPRKLNSSIWFENPDTHELVLEKLRKLILNQGVIVKNGKEFDDWDLEIKSGFFCFTRLLMAIEDHGWQKYMIKFKFWPKISNKFLLLFVVFSTLAISSINNSPNFITFFFGNCSFNYIVFYDQR